MPRRRRAQPTVRGPGPIAAALLLVGRATRGALAPIVGVVSPLGWIVLGAAVVSLLVGALLGWLEFVALGAVLLAAPVVSIAFHALRAYEPGDDRRYVHWRTSARTGQLMVRRFEETRRSQLVILFDADRDKYASDDEFELAVSIVASLGVQVIRDGTLVAVVSEATALRTGTASTLLDDSCRLEPVTTRHASAREFPRAATLRLPPPSLVVLVGGSGLAVTDARAVQTLFGRDAVTIGLRADSAASSRIATVDRLRVATVGSLADLPRLVRGMS